MSISQSMTILTSDKCGVKGQNYTEMLSTCTQWQQSRHVGCAKLPQRTNCVTSWNNQQLFNKRLGVTKSIVNLPPAIISWFGLPFPTVRSNLRFAASALLCLPSTCQNKTCGQPANSTTTEPNLSFLKVPHFLLHDRQTLFQRRFAGVRRDNIILLLHTNRRHFQLHKHVPSNSQCAQTTGNRRLCVRYDNRVAHYMSAEYLSNVTVSHHLTRVRSGIWSGYILS